MPSEKKQTFTERKDTFFRIVAGMLLVLGFFGHVLYYLGKTLRFALILTTFAFGIIVGWYFFSWYDPDIPPVSIPVWMTVTLLSFNVVGWVWWTGVRGPIFARNEEEK